jgi:hypothetical protein
VRPKKLALLQRILSGYSDWPGDARRELNVGKAAVRDRQLMAEAV